MNGPTSTTASGAEDATLRTISHAGLPPYPFRVHRAGTDSVVSREIAERGTWEPLETEIAMRLLPLYRTFLDIGGNIGWYSALAREIMLSGSAIHAFEPDPGNFALLRQNAGRSARLGVHLVNAALSDRVGVDRLFLSGTNMGDHRLYESEGGRAAVDVQITTLDAYFAGRSPGAFFAKLDTQGSEPRIFAGARTVFRPDDAASAYVIEFWPHGMVAAGADVAAFAHRLGFLPQRPLIIDHAAGKVRATTWSDLLARVDGDLAPASRRFVDLLLVTPGSAAHMAVADLLAA